MKKSVTRSKKRAVIDEDEEQVVAQNIMVVEEQLQVKSKAPVKTSPNKPTPGKNEPLDVTKKVKLDDGKAAASKVATASPAKSKIEEEKK